MNYRIAILLWGASMLACDGRLGDVDMDPEVPEQADAGVVADAAPQADGAPVGDMCGDTRELHRVYYGTELPSYVPMSPGQVWAVGSWGDCTGTLIAPTWVLTAEHCGVRAGARFCIGEQPDSPNVCMTAVRVVDNPAADMTLAELDVDATTRLPGVVPVPIMTDPMGAQWLGAMAEAAGYGSQEDGGYGEREFTAEPIVALSGHDLTIDGEGQHGVCFGDSGGPVFVISADGTVRTAGALSNGDENCVGEDVFTRTDTNVDWIEQYTGPTLVEGAECGSVDAVGRCNGNVAMWCGADGMLASEQCGDTCGWDAAHAGYRCITGADSCGGYDALGGCDGQVARWCEQGAPKQRDCAACGLLCQRITGVGAYCTEDPCQGLDYLGHCDGEVAEWCNGGQFHSEDCAATGQTCGYVNDEIGYYCH